MEIALLSNRTKLQKAIKSFNFMTFTSILRKITIIIVVCSVEFEYLINSRGKSYK